MSPSPDCKILSIPYDISRRRVASRQSPRELSRLASLCEKVKRRARRRVFISPLARAKTEAFERRSSPPRCSLSAHRSRARAFSLLVPASRKRQTRSSVSVPIASRESFTIARARRARASVRSSAARADTATARSSPSHLDDDERSPELIERQRHGSVARAAGLIVRRRRRRSIGRSIGRSIDRPLGLVDWFVYIVYICRLQPSTSATGVVYDPSDQRTGHDLY